MVTLAARGRRRLLDGEDRAAARDAIASCDVLHLHEVWDPVCLQLASVARGLDIPYVISPHGALDAFPMSHKRLKKRLYLALAGRRMISRSAAVFCTAAAEAAQSSRWHRGAASVVLPLVMDLTPFHHLPGPSEAGHLISDLDPSLPRLVFIGRLDPKKGIEHVIDAAAALIDGGTPCNLVIAGSGEPGYVASLRSLVHSRGHADQVRFAGYLGGTAKVSLFQWADLFVLPTYQENWGIALYEALAAGTPVVTTRAVATWPELEATGAAFVVENDTAVLAARLATLLTDRSRLHDLGQEARRVVLRDHDAATTASKYLAAYRAVGAGTGPGR